MKILITGGAGYIGSHTVLKLLECGYDIEVIDSFCNSYPESLKRIEYLNNFKDNNGKLNVSKGDIRDEETLERIFEESNAQKKPINAVIHFAGLKSVSESLNFPHKYWDFNVGGSSNLLKVMDKYHCRNIVFSSSATVYKYKKNNNLISESSPLNPTNPYGETKVEVENMLRKIYSKNPKNWRISILRYFNPISAHNTGKIGEHPFGTPSNIFPLISKVASGEIKEFKIYGNDYPTKDGTAVRDYIHVMDLAEAHILALKKIMQDDFKFMILNIGTGIGTSVIQLIEKFKKINECDIPYSFLGRRDGDLPFVVADNSLASRVLNWKPSRKIEDMCRDEWKWRMQNPCGFKS